MATTFEEIQQRQSYARRLGWSEDEIQRATFVEMAKTNQDKSPTVKTVKKSKKGNILTDLIPVAGGIAGGTIGSFLATPGAGTIIGGAAGSAAGEALRQKIVGEDTNYGKIATEGGLGLAGGVAGKVISGGARLAGKVAGKVIPKGLALATGTSAETIGRAVSRPEQVAKAMRGETPIMPIVQESRKALKSLVSISKKEYGEEFSKILKDNAKISVPLNEVRENLLGVLNKYGAKVTQPSVKFSEDFGILDLAGKPIKKVKNILGNVSFARSSISDAREVSSLQSLIKDINTWEDYSISAINVLKQRLQNAFRATASNRYNAIVTELSNSVDDLLVGKVPKLGIINQQFTAKQELAKNLGKRIESMGAEGTISNLFGKNKTEVRGLFKELEKVSGADILEQMADIRAGQALNPLVPSTGSRTLDVVRSLLVGGVGGFAGGPGGAIAGLAATSPRVVGGALTKVGKFAQSIPSAVKTGAGIAGGVASQAIGQATARIPKLGDTPDQTQFPEEATVDSGLEFDQQFTPPAPQEQKPYTRDQLEKAAAWDLQNNNGKGLVKIKQLYDLYYGAEAKEKPKTEKQRLFGGAAEGAGYALKLLETGNVATGPVSGRLESLKSQTVGVSKEQQDYLSTIALARSSLLNAFLGGNIPPAEYARIEAGIPTANDPLPTAKQKLKTFIRELNRFSESEVSVPFQQEPANIQFQYETP